MEECSFILLPSSWMKDSIKQSEVSYPDVYNFLIKSTCDVFPTPVALLFQSCFILLFQLSVQYEVTSAGHSKWPPDTSRYLQIPPERVLSQSFMFCNQVTVPFFHSTVHSSQKVSDVSPHGLLHSVSATQTSSCFCKGSWKLHNIGMSKMGDHQHIKIMGTSLVQISCQKSVWWWLCHFLTVSETQWIHLLTCPLKCDLKGRIN